MAVKVLQASAITDPDAMARFRREGVTACRVRHPNAVAVLDFGVTAAAIAYLVMELLAGYPLEDEMKGGRALPLGRALRIVVAGVRGPGRRPSRRHRAPRHQARRTCSSTRRAGRRCRRCWTSASPRSRAAAALQQRVTLEGWIVGTPVYMAPERFGDQEITARPTSTASGIMLFQMLTGRLPFDADSDPMAVAMKHKHDEPPRLRALRPDAPAAVEEAILSALRKHPSQRPTAAQFAALLQAALPPSPAPSPSR